MNQDDLSKRQINQLTGLLFPSVNFLNRLERRMTSQGFPPDDSLYVAVAKAQAALQGVYVQLHYLGCDSGVGRPPTAPREADGAA